MIVWLVFWTSAILVALWHLGGAALAGEPAAALVLAIWLAAAGFGPRRGPRASRRCCSTSGRRPARTATTPGATASTAPSRK